MYNNKFANLCHHDNVQRVNDDFVYCANCKQMIINKINDNGNKTSKDFAQNNNHRNFNRNFSNEIQSPNLSYPSSQINNGIEYYSDRFNINKIMIDRKSKYYTNPPKYNVIINNEKFVLSNIEINKLILDTKVIRTG